MIQQEYVWYGEIPAEWGFQKIKYVTELRNEKVTEIINEIYIGLENIESTSGNYLPSSEEQEQNIEGTSNKFYKEDVLFGKLRPYLAKCIEAEFDGVCSTELLVLNADRKKILPQYLKLLMLSPKFIDLINSSTYGAKMPRASWDFIRDVEIPLPSVELQSKIVSFVSDEVSNIDSLISKKKNLINLFEQQRQSIITEAVTKGLNPNVKMKDSGIEWIGEVPEHWEVNLLKRFLSKITDGSHFSPEIVDEGLPYVTVKDLKNGYIDTINALKISEEDYQALIKNGCKPNVNDVLLSKDGTIGKVALVKESNFVVLSSLAILTPSHNVAPRYLEYWLNSLLNKEQMESYLAGAALRRITLQTIGKLNMILPPMNEQKEIVVYLDKKLKPVTDVINKVKQEINLIKEYRQSLIYEAVTGKIDVRELELD